MNNIQSVGRLASRPYGSPRILDRLWNPTALLLAIGRADELQITCGRMGLLDDQDHDM
ncbi:MAG: hypothetical protein JSV37_05525 [Anaerolineaceae bacterium]|nr:MAG: hypothetical protein JSV37_05525 [Anaerolineaceae bacterium]